MERFLASRKMYRNFGDIGEQIKEKCHLCGNYEVLEIEWGKLERQIVREKEKLCGVCFVKRLFPGLMGEILGLRNIGFPSTLEMATVL